jgi:RHS repeat-associated protein
MWCCSHRRGLRPAASFVRELACLFAFIFLFGANVLRAQTVLVGDQGIESNIDSNATGLAEAFPATASASGQVGSINVLLDESSASTKIYVGLYADAGGHPGSLLTQGSITQFALGTWNSVTLNPVSVSSGTTYWIAILGATGGEPYFRDRNTTACHSQTSSKSNLTSLPNTWSTGQTWNTCYISAYAVSGTFAATAMIGNQAVEASMDNNPAGRAEAFPATANTTGSIGTITLFLDPTSGAGPVFAGLYADNNGKPGTLLGQGSTSQPVAGSWNQISIAPSNVTAGQKYWIAVLGTKATSPYFRDRQTTSCESQTTTQSTLTSLPTTWTTGSTWPTCYISAYGLPATSSPVLSTSPASFIFTAVQGGSNPAPANLNVSNTGTGSLSFTVSTDEAWLSAAPASGTAPQTVQVSAAVGTLAPATYTGHVTMTAAGVQGSPSVAAVTLTVEPFDPPSIKASASPPTNANGWNNSNVTVSFACTAGSYPLASCSAPVVVSTNGANQSICGKAIDTSGVSSTACATVNLDETPPTITAAVSPAPDSSGWNNSNVTVSFTCMDSLSGIARCPQPVLVSSSGANQVISGTATDLAGNTSAPASVTLDVELTLPSIVASPSPAANAQGWNNTSVTVNFTCTPAVAPITSCASLRSIVTEAAGQTVSGTVSDAANNTNTAQVTLNIATTPPAITAAISPQPNGNGWNNSAVTVSFTCTKTTAPLATCPLPQTVSTEGANQAISGSATDVAGNSATATAHVSIAKTPPTVSASASPQPNASGWNNSAVTVTFTCTATTAPIAICPQPQTVSIKGASQVVSGTVTDVAGNLATATVTLNIALTPPKIVATATPAPNANGWNASSVTVSFICTSTTAPVASCPPPQTISMEGAGQNVSGTVTDAAGNSSTATLTLNIGTKLPAIVASVAPSPNAAGWNNSTVTVNFACAPGTAPIAVCPPPVTITTEGTNQSVTGTTSDLAGNAGTVSVTLNIALTPPKISAALSPAPNASGWNDSTVTVTFTCTAMTAPIATCPAPATVSTEGANQIIPGTATDVAGNSASASATVNLDETPPTLSVTSPTNGATFTSSALNVTGSVSDALSGVSTVTCNGIAATISTGSFSCALTLTTGANTITVQATDVAGNTTTQTEGVTFVTGPSITSFGPASAPIGSQVTVAGTNFTTNGATPQVTLSAAGGGTIPAPISSFNGTSLSFVVPTCAATGVITITVNGQSATSATPLTIAAASTFALSVSPGSATLLPGETVALQVSLSSSNGFTQLANLSVSGLPSGVTGTFQPQQITAGGFSTLTLSAPSGQSATSATITVSASATVQGIAETQTATAGVSVQPAGNVAFQGQVAVTNPSVDVPLVGLTVRFTGLNYQGASTGCTASTTTDSGGNFVFASLPSACGGAQIVQYDPSTVSSPPGAYSGVNLSYVLTSGQVTTPGIVVHLPQVNNAETVQVFQNWSADQTFTFKSIPNLTITVYAGTTLTLSNGTQPNPFPLSVVEIPYEKLPEQMQPNPTQDPVFAMSIEPFNSSSSQPVAVSFPNRSNLAPGTNMPLSSLNPVLGMMVNYGTGTVSANGAQVIPDPDPANPGHLYGISHFDWHFPTCTAANSVNPSSDPSSPTAGDPVDPASGLLVVTKTDLAFGGARGQVAITRTFRGISTNPGPFGIGTNHNYGYTLDTTNVNSGLINLIMPDGNQFPFAQQANGTFVNSTIPSMQGATISNLACITTVYGYGCGGTLRWKDGTQFLFQPLLIGKPWFAFLMTITDVNNNTILLVHSQSVPIEITQVIDPVGRSLNLTYDDTYRITSISDPIGRTVQYTYNSQGTLATVTDANGGVTRYAYDSNNNLLSITDPRGILYLQNTYDPTGHVVAQVTADGGVTTFSYTQLNPGIIVYIGPSPASLAGCDCEVILRSEIVNTSPVIFNTVTDPRGNTTVYHFDPAGFLLDVTDALGEKTIYTRAAGTDQLTSVTDPLGRVTAYTYDANGNTTNVTRLAGTPNAVTTAFTYDPKFNKVTSITDALGHTTSFTYDKAGNLLSVTDPVNEQSNFIYDANGELTASADPLGNATQFAYLNGDVVRITDPLGRTTARVSDPVDRLLSLSNPLGQTSSYQYTPLNQVTQVTDPRGGQTSFSYDGNGNLLSVTDANQHTTAYVYDNMDRVLTRTDPLSHLEIYQYDLDGNLTQFTDRRGVASVYTYDPLNRITLANFGNQSSTNYSYDAVSRLTQAVDSITGTIAHSYDGLGRLVSEVTPQGVVSYAYDLAGRRTSMSASGQPAANYFYDNANRLTQITQGASGVSFSYDADSRRTSLTLPNGVTMSYAYDAASQLTGIGYGSLGNLTYAYDLAGRRTTVGGSFARSNVPATLTNASYNANNQLTQFGPSNLTYDANGNLTSDSAKTYTWDARNRLTSLSGTVAASFQYDAFGRRVSKTVGATTQYLYDGMNPVQELSGGAPSANLLETGVDEFFTRTDANGAANALTDALGSSIALTNSSGSIVASYTYDPFGNTTSTGSSANPYEYTGRENDGTGLYFYRARYYSPTLQRFISEDPAGLAGSGVNLYAYAFNSPTNLTDPSGEDAGTAIRCALFFAVMPVGCDIFSILQPAPPKTSGRKQPDCNHRYGGNSCEGIQPVLGPYILLAPVGGEVAGGFEAAAGESTALSPYRVTTPGESFSHYGFAENAPNFEGGLRPGGFATPIGDLSGAEAQSGLALPQATPPNAVYTVTPQPGTWIRVNPVTAPQFGQPGGLPEVQFPGGTGPGTVSPPRPIP